jgi:hypothetical protein
MLEIASIGRVDPHVSLGECNLGVADHAVAFVAGLDLAGVVGLAKSSFECEVGVLGHVLDIYQARRGARRLETLGNDQRHRLVIEAHPVIRKHRARTCGGVLHFGRPEIGLRGCVVVRHHREHAWDSLRCGSLDRGDTPARDRGPKYKAVSGLVATGMLVCIRCGAAHLEWAVDTVDRLPEHARPRRGLVIAHDRLMPPPGRPAFAEASGAPARS